ncbi:MAG: cobalt-precorrin 5A hydrolase, partial [Desulfitobacteriaceae bacterium]|nr:cobalt-precorrin 5A hydrolase [Desulfitobacteriaceae bacterium]
MRKAVIAVSRGGLETSLKIKGFLDCDVYVLSKYSGQDGVKPISTGLREFVGDVFQNYREIIMVMSCGIAVRSIAPYIKSKLSDPAVVVLDEKGNHVISLLSGHLG